MKSSVVSESKNSENVGGSTACSRVREQLSETEKKSLEYRAKEFGFYSASSRKLSKQGHQPPCKTSPFVTTPERLTLLGDGKGRSLDTKRFRTLHPINLLLSLFCYPFHKQITFICIGSNNALLMKRNLWNNRALNRSPAFNNPDCIIFRPLMGSSLPSEQIGILFQFSFLPRKRNLGHQVLLKYHAEC